MLLWVLAGLHLDEVCFGLWVGFLWWVLVVGLVVLVWVVCVVFDLGFGVLF